MATKLKIKKKLSDTTKVPRRPPGRPRVTEKAKTRSIQVPQSEWDLWQRLAARQKTSVSQLVRITMSQLTLT